MVLTCERPLSNRDRERNWRPLYEAFAKYESGGHGYGCGSSQVGKRAEGNSAFTRLTEPNPALMQVKALPTLTPTPGGPPSPVPNRMGGSLGSKEGMSMPPVTSRETAPSSNR